MREYSRRARRAPPDPQLWIQGFGIPVDEDGHPHGGPGRARGGIEDLWTWGFEACGHMSTLRGAIPTLIWEADGARSARWWRPMRLGVEAALVDGHLLPGDVEVDDGTVVAVASAAPGTASPRRASSTSRSTASPAST